MVPEPERGTISPWRDPELRAAEQAQDIQWRMYAALGAGVVNLIPGLQTVKLAVLVALAPIVWNAPGVYRRWRDRHDPEGEDAVEVRYRWYGREYGRDAGHLAREGDALAFRGRHSSFLLGTNDYSTRRPGFSETPHELWLDDREWSVRVIPQRNRRSWANRLRRAGSPKDETVPEGPPLGPPPSSRLPIVSETR